MKPQSAKAKGRAAQQLVRDRLLEAFPNLTQDDVRSTSMGANGSDILLSAQGKITLPYNFEVKARKGVKTQYDWIEQAQLGGDPKLTPVVVFKGDRKKPLCLVTFEHFLELIQRPTKETIN
jgi:hypothetical protein